MPVSNPAATPNATYSPGSAPPSTFQAVMRPDPAEERARYIRYHADNLARCLTEGARPSDIAHYADHLTALVMEARAVAA